MSDVAVIVAKAGEGNKLHILQPVDRTQRRYDHFRSKCGKISETEEGDIVKIKDLPENQLCENCKDRTFQFQKTGRTSRLWDIEDVILK